jgi:hypothetical protein
MAASFSAPIKSRRLQQQHSSRAWSFSYAVVCCDLRVAWVPKPLQCQETVYPLLHKPSLLHCWSSWPQSGCCGYCSQPSAPAATYLRLLSVYSCPASTLYRSTNVQCWQVPPPCTGLSLRINGTESNSCLLIWPDHCQAVRGTLLGRAFVQQ